MGILNLILNILLKFFSWKSSSSNKEEFSYYKDELNREQKEYNEIKEKYESVKNSTDITDAILSDELYSKLLSKSVKIKNLQKRLDKITQGDSD